jgi:molybdopterin/thiamine biosynthesis adenylyltransferase
MNPEPCSIRFPHGRFRALRARLLEDCERESFAVLLARREVVAESIILNVIDLRHFGPADYESRSLAHVRPRREAIHRLLAELQARHDVDTLIDVHTHPFCAGGVAFSGVDDADERRFCRWLDRTFDGIHYASIVLSRSDYAARLWRMESGRPAASIARIRTQTAPERWPAAGEVPVGDVQAAAVADPEQGFLARTALALGLDTLRTLMDGQAIAIVGAGGLGSVIAENLIHTGFRDLVLIDPDRVEITNLNRIVGATRADAEAGRLKVDVLRRHLLGINPDARVAAEPADLREPRLEPLLAAVDWIIIATDNQLSRFHAQAIALRHFVPLLSTGVNISVKDGRITDMSGETLVVRAGDGYCLHCLGRLDPTRIAAEEHAAGELGRQLVARGYVQGFDVKEPAVKTLNAIVGAMAVEALLNQYTERQPHRPIQVYENNAGMAIYPDTASIEARPRSCFVCGLFDA